MAILNKEALDAIYRLIGNNAKKEAKEKKDDYKTYLFIASYIAIIAGVLLLILVPAFGSIFVYNAFSRFGYYVPGIVVIILGIVFIIINMTKFSNKKKPDDFDAYAYGKEHFQEYLSDDTGKKDYDQLVLQRAIALADNLVSAKILSSETGTSYHGKSHRARTYHIYEYELTYNDGKVKRVKLRDSLDSNSIYIIKYYLPDGSDEGESM